MDEADLESHGCENIYGGGIRRGDNQEIQYERTYGLLMRDPSYEKAVVDRIQHLVHRDKTAPVYFPGPWEMKAPTAPTWRRPRPGSNPTIPTGC